MIVGFYQGLLVVGVPVWWLTLAVVAFAAWEFGVKQLVKRLRKR